MIERDDLPTITSADEPEYELTEDCKFLVNKNEGYTTEHPYYKCLCGGTAFILYFSGFYQMSGRCVQCGTIDEVYSG